LWPRTAPFTLRREWSMNVLDFAGDGIRFAHPVFVAWWSLLLVVACVVAVRGLVDWLARTSVRRSYSDPANLERTTRPLSLFGHVLSTASWCLVALLLLAALSYPF